MMNYWIFHTLLLSIILWGLLVVTSKSPINAVIYLVLLYLAGGGLFLLMDHTFLGLTLIIVYVGAIAILFLFTVFMINLRTTTGGSLPPLSLGLLLLPLLLTSLGGEEGVATLFTTPWGQLVTRPLEMHSLGDLIFNGYPLALLLIAFLLLLVMVAIIKIHLDDHSASISIIPYEHPLYLRLKLQSLLLTTATEVLRNSPWDHNQDHRHLEVGGKGSAPGIPLPV